MKKIIENEHLTLDDIELLLEKHNDIAFVKCKFLNVESLLIKRDLVRIYFDTCDFTCDFTLLQKPNTRIERIDFDSCFFGIVQHLCLHPKSHIDKKSNYELEVNIKGHCERLAISHMCHNGEINIMALYSGTIEHFFVHNSLITELELNGKINDVSITHGFYDEDLENYKENCTYPTVVSPSDDFKPVGIQKLDVNVTGEEFHLSVTFVEDLQFGDCIIDRAHVSIDSCQRIAINEAYFGSFWCSVKEPIKVLKFIGLIAKDSHLCFRNMDVELIDFTNVICAGQVHLYSREKTENNTTLLIANSNLGESHFVGFKFKKVAYTHSIIDCCTFKMTLWPQPKMLITFSAKERRELCSQLKKSYSSINDKVKEQKFYLEEMNSFSEQLKKEKPDNFLIDFTLINITKYISNFGTNPIRAVFNLLFFHLLVISFLTYGVQNLSIDSFKNFYFYTLNPVHRVKDNPLGETVNFAYQSSIFIKAYVSLFVYQIVMSLRKVTSLK
ncbi:hypothetical protein [Vibrio splendidus]|uniref:hypothetical protein n=1 Tax=Vibrio splendidus TaxID=29497 RepID=UPI002468FD1F|nr:hypothetical protein [Vibrio splendidus]MDH5888918.1 hypothetical protein [Vibrio splendidus]